MRLAHRHQWKRFGYASVSFAQPVSIKEYCEKKEINFAQLAVEQRFEEVAILANKLMKDIEKTVPVVPVVLLASVFLQSKHQAISKHQVLMNAKELMKSIESKGAQILFPNKDKQINLEGAIEMLCLRHLVDSDGDSYIMSKDATKVLEYYQNSIAHWL